MSRCNPWKETPAVQACAATQACVLRRALVGQRVRQHRTQVAVAVLVALAGYGPVAKAGIWGSGGVLLGTEAPPSQESPLASLDLTSGTGGKGVSVGWPASGALHMDNGGRLKSSQGVVGYVSDAHGWVSVSDPGTLWVIEETLQLGYRENSHGVVQIENGGKVEALVGRLASGPETTASVTVSGAGSRLDFSFPLHASIYGLEVGMGGNAAVTIDEGGVVRATNVKLGSLAAGEGTLHLRGNAAQGRGVLETQQLIHGAGKATLDLDGGILRALVDEVDYLSRFTAVTLGQRGAWFDTNGHAVGVASALASAPGQASGLTKLGSGTLTLTGANTYVGDTTVYDGTLLAGNAAALPQHAAYVVHGGTLDLNHFDLAATGLSGRGGQVLVDGAELSLEGADSYRFAGSLVGGSGSTVRKLGAGQWILAGDSSGFAGRTTVQGGGVGLEGGRLGGSLQLAAGSMLWGSGAVGPTTVAAGAMVAPGSALSGGNPIGTLVVNGDLTFQPGATLQVHAGTDGTRDQVQVAGTAHLAGEVVWAGPHLNTGTVRDYVIVQAGNAVQGQFSGVRSTYDYAYLTPSLRYGPQQVTLQLEKTAEFASQATTPSQSGVAQAVEQLPASHRVYQHLLGQTTQTAARELAQLSGDFHSGVANGLHAVSALAGVMPLRHLRPNLTAGWRAGAPVAQVGGSLPESAWPSSKALPVWAEAVGHWQSFADAANATQLKQHTGGVFAGGDGVLASGWRLGGALGYTRAEARMGERSAQSDVNSYSAAVYGGKSLPRGRGRLNVLGGLAYTWHDIATERRLPSTGQTLRASFKGSTAQLFGEVGYALGQYDQHGVEPFVGLAVSEQRTRSFQEQGGFAALSAARSRETQTSSTLGVRAHRDFQIGRSEGRLRATLAWRHAWGDVQPRKSMAFEGGQNFTVAGAPQARNTAVVGVEAEMTVARRAALVAGFQGEYGRGSRDQSVHVKLRWAF